jgi:elongation factor Ts
MVAIELVREVRARSGVSLDACKKALEETGGNVDEALEALRVKGLAKKIDPSQSGTEGRVHTYVHGGKHGVLVEVNCKTDFVARSPEFIALCDTIAMQIVAARPICVSRDNVPPEQLERERRVAAQSVPERVPAGQREKVIEGKLNKWLSEVCLMDQESFERPGLTIAQLCAELSTKTGEPITVRRFVTLERGEGVARSQVVDYADEVQAMVAIASATPEEHLIKS